MSRANIALIVVLIAQLALIAVVFSEDDTTDTQLSRGGALLTGFQAAEVTEIIIEDDAGLTLTLAQDAAGNWVLPTADGFPAQNTVVASRLDLIERFDAERLVTRTTDNLRRFDVAEDDFFRRITLRTAADDSYTLYVGALGTGANRYTRVEGDSEVYLNSDMGQSALTTDPTTWIDTVYFSVLPEDLVRITIENENGTVELVQADGAWSLPELAPNEVADTAAIDRLTSRFTTYRLDDPVGSAVLDEYGLDAPLVTVTLEVRVPDPDAPPPADDADTAEGDSADNAAEPAPPTVIETRTLLIGAATGQGGHYTQFSTAEYVVTTPETFVNELTGLGRAAVVNPQPYSVFGG
jgi:hypothetical protein